MGWTFAGGVNAALIGTSLPGSPQDGQQFVLVDSTSAPTYSWLLQYVAAKSTNKWIFIGGSSGFSEVATSEATSSASYAALATAGPSFTVPIAGDYLVEIGYTGGNTNGTNTDWMSYDIGGTGANDNDGIQFKQAGAANTQVESFAKTQKKSGLAASTALVAKYKTSGGSAAYGKRFMRVTPVAIGG